jgi:hypothetical protein
MGTIQLPVAVSLPGLRREFVILDPRIECFHGLNFRLEHINAFGIDQSVGDFAKRYDRGLVVLLFDQGLGSVRNLASPLGRSEYHFETIVDPVKTIFYSDSCHFVVSKLPVDS